MHRNTHTLSNFSRFIYLFDYRFNRKLIYKVIYKKNKEY